MVRRASLLIAMLLCLAFAVPASAQKNPFADDEEEDADAKAEATKKAAAKKAEEKKKAEEAKKAAEAEAAAAADAELEAEEAAEPTEEEAAAQAAADEAALVAEQEEAAAEAARLLAEDLEEEEEEEPVASGGRVGLSQNFGKGELITTAVVLPLGLGLAIGGASLFGEPSASMTSPRLGSLDYRLGIASHGDLQAGAPFTFGIFDIAGVAYPAALGTFYLVSGLYLWGADEPMLSSQSINIDHSMIGMAQTVGWTALAAGTIHLLIGRQKPYDAFRRSAYASDKGTNLSFVSTTTALSFAMSSFAARDYMDWAMKNDQSFVTGAILPYTVLYGLSAMIGYSAMYGQQHYFSDIAVSALLGTLIGNLTYVSHFDRDGRPRAQRSRVAVVGPTLLTHPDERRALMGLGLSSRF